MSDTRLIEKWLPIHELSIESERERRSMTALPAPYYLHVWWARRPLVACRAAVLGSLLSVGADRTKFMHDLGIHGDPIAARESINRANAQGLRLKKNPYGYPRAFSWNAGSNPVSFSGQAPPAVILDPTAGGGSIPFEVARLGFESYANDLNPVSAFLISATVEWPICIGEGLVEAFDALSERFIGEAEPRFHGVFPEEDEDVVITGYLWARTVHCPHCEGLVPLSPHWRIAPSGVGVRLQPHVRNGPNTEGRICSFELVSEFSQQSQGTVAGGRATCPFPDCGRVIEGESIKVQARAGTMGEQLYAVAFKRRIKTFRRDGLRGRDKWERGFRAATRLDENLDVIRSKLLQLLPEWEINEVIPSERIPAGLKTREPLNYGMPFWRDLFNPRQLLCHGIAVEVFQKMVFDDKAKGELSDLRKASYGYLAIALDKLLSFNCRLSLWDPSTIRVRNKFDQHNFSFKWSYAEMPPFTTGFGIEWAVGQVSKCIKELIELTPLVKKISSRSTSRRGAENDAQITVSCKSADALDHLKDASVDVVIMDPPYYDNVMYAELSDFFYVWLKRTAGLIYPDLFQRRLTDKDNEAVKNPSLFKDQEKPARRAAEDYQRKMQYIFEECRRVLKPNGIMTVMFNHKATDAWDALAKGLLEAGFMITASWPVASEAESSLHIRDKAAVRSTIFLVCRPRLSSEGQQRENVYWEDIESEVIAEIRERVSEFESAGIGGVDLYLSCFGPALKVLSEHWPLSRGQPRPKPKTRRKARKEPVIVDSYAVLPEDALTTARQAVQHWRLEKLAGLSPNQELDEFTGFFVLAWDTFRAPNFEFDEALQLSRAVGVDLESDIVGRIALKKGSQIHLLDSGDRVNKVAMGQADLNSSMLDVLHRAAHLSRTVSLDKAREMLEGLQLTQNQEFKTSLKAVLEVLPPSKRFTNIELKGDLAQAASDFDALMRLNQLIYGEEALHVGQLDVLKPEQS